MEKYTADSAECKAAVDRFVEDVTRILDTPQKKYRAMAHCMTHLKKSFSEIKRAAVEANRAQAKKALSSADEPTVPVDKTAG